MIWIIGLPILGVLGFFALAFFGAIALKCPRFFLSLFGLVALVGLLYLGLGVEPERHVALPPLSGDSPGDGLPPGVLTEFHEPEVHNEADATLASLPAPDWLGTAGARDGDALTHVIEGELYVPPQDADNDALRKAAELARDYLAQSLGNKVAGWNVPLAYVSDRMVEERFLEPVKRDYGTMHRTHLLVKLTPEHRRELEQLWRHQVVRARIWTAGGTIGLAVLLLATIAGYLKLDDATQGYYSGRLKLAGLAVLAGGATTVLALVRSAVG